MDTQIDLNMKETIIQDIESKAKKYPDFGITIIDR